MAKPVSRVRFALRFGGAVTDFSGFWTYFDDSIGYIEDWSGLLSEGPISGDIIEQDWTDGALWQQGKNKTYSFDVPFTALVSANLTEPNLWDSYSDGGIELLKTFRGPQLTMRREFIDASGNLVRQEQAIGVLVTDLAATVGLGRVIHSVAIFQNLTGSWVEAPMKAATFAENFSKGISPAVWSTDAAFTSAHDQCIIVWDAGDTATHVLKTKKYFDLTGSSVFMEGIDFSEIKEGGYVHAVTLTDSNTGKFISFQITRDGDSTVIQAYSSTLGPLGTETLWSPATHRWLNISELNGVLYWHVSSDRVVWTQLFAMNASTLAGYQANKVSIGLRLQGSQTASGVVNVANINTTVARPVVSVMTDTFSTTLRPNMWSADGVYANGGRGVFIQSSSANKQYLMSRPIFSLTGSSVYLNCINISDPISNTGAYYPLQLYPQAPQAGSFLGAYFGSFIGFKIEYSFPRFRISAVADDFGVTLPASVPMHSNLHSWLKISESGGTITWSTSGDGKTWTTMATVLVSALNSALWRSSALRIGASFVPKIGNLATTRIIELDNLNTLG